MLTQFRKKSTAIALAALGALGLMAPTAQAVNLADDGLGEVLLYPYYSIRQTDPADPSTLWQTFIHIFNSSAYTVPVKVRFREAENSRDVLDFTVVLSPYDVWTAFTANNAAGNPVLRTVDNSCTAPGFLPVAGGLNPDLKERAFRDLAYTGDLDDGGSQGIDRVREGHVEIISLGHAPPGGLVASGATHNPITGIPADCVRVANAFNHLNPGALAATAAEFGEPINALKGNGYMIRVGQGQGAGVDPTVLANFYNPAPNLVNLPGLGGGVMIGIDGAVGPGDPTHFGVPRNLIQTLARDRNAAAASPANLGGDLFGLDGRTNANPGPSLGSGFPPVSVVRDDTAFAGPRTIMDEWDHGVDAVSAVLMRDDVYNEWAARLGDGAFNNTTEWVINFPTKHFYVDMDEAVSAAVPFNNPTLPGTSADDGAIAPFAEDFADFGESCEVVWANIWNREEANGGQLSPFPLPIPYELCYETNVITFRGEVVDPVLGSQVAINIPTDELPEDVRLQGAYYGAMNLDLPTDKALGSDPRADQRYNNSSTTPTTVSNVTWGQFCSAFLGEIATGVDAGLPPAGGDGFVGWPAGYDNTNPPSDVNLGVFPTPAPPPVNPGNYREFLGIPAAGGGPIPAGTGFFLGSTLVLAGINARPYVSQLTSTGTVVLDNGQCPLALGDAGPFEPAVWDSPNGGIGAAYYYGLPVHGYMMSFRTLANQPELSYSAILDHGYDRNIDVAPAVHPDDTATPPDGGTNPDALALCDAFYNRFAPFGGRWEALMPPCLPLHAP